MARGCSVCTLYSLNFVLFLIGAALLAFFPIVVCKGVCHVNMSVLESLNFVVLMQAVGGALLVFSFMGCCLAKSGKKRYRCPYLLVVLIAVLGGGLMVAFDQGLLFKPLTTFDPDAPSEVNKAIDGLASDGMQSFYTDFAQVFHAAECKVTAGAGQSSAVACNDCSPIETAFTTCMADWHQSAAGDEYLKKCSAKFAASGASKGCDKDCTVAFCQCAGTLGQAVEDYAKYIKYALLGVGGLLLLLLVAGICVSRKPEPAPMMEQQGQVFLLEQPSQQRRQPVLA